MCCYKKKSSYPFVTDILKKIISYMWNKQVLHKNRTHVSIYVGCNSKCIMWVTLENQTALVSALNRSSAGPKRMWRSVSGKGPNGNEQVINNLQILMNLQCLPPPSENKVIVKIRLENSIYFHCLVIRRLPQWNVMWDKILVLCALFSINHSTLQSVKFCLCETCHFGDFTPETVILNHDDRKV